LAELCSDQYSVEPDASTAAIAAQLADLRSLRRHLSELEGWMTDYLVEKLPEEGQKVEGVGLVLPHWSARSPKWDSQALVAHLTALSRESRVVDEDTGEIETEAGAVVRVLTMAAPFTASMQWRTNALRALGVDLEDFRSVGGWKRDVRIEAVP